MMRLNLIVRRQVALLVLASFLGSLVTPVIQAQDLDIYTGESGRRPAEYRPEFQDDYEFAGNVAGRVALKEDLEKRWADAAVRSNQARQRLQRLQGARPPSGVDANDWYRRRDEEVSRLSDYLSRSDRAIGDYRRSLGNVYGQLDKDRSRLTGVTDSGLKQELGTLIGVGGMAAAPIWARPTMSNLSGSIGRAIKGRQLASVTNRIASSQNRSAALGQKLNTPAPARNSWQVAEANGRVVLRGANGSVKDLGSATTRSGDGSSIRNDAAFRKGEYYNQLYSTRSNIGHQIDSLRHTRSMARTAKQRAAIDQQITKLEGKQSQLQKDIAEYDSTKKPAGSTLKNMAASAAKWAAFSVGITVASNAIQQLAQNNWDVRSIDWGAATAALRTPEFWGGTAGSFGVSMLASALIPGGAFVKTLAAIAGAGIGWQLGSGNLMQTDWMELGVTSLGATIGSLIGTALGGPVGAFIGGVAGHYASTWILGKVREWLEAPIEPYGPKDRRSYQSAEAPPGVYRDPNQTSRGDDTRYSDPSALKERMDQAYMRMMQYARDPSRQMQFDRSRREYLGLKGQLDQMRASGKY